MRRKKTPTIFNLIDDDKLKLKKSFNFKLSFGNQILRLKSHFAFPFPTLYKLQIF